MDYVDGKYNIILGVSIGAACFGIVIIAFGFCLCCHKGDQDEYTEGLMA